AGAVYVQVLTDHGQGSGPNARFTYRAPPTLTKLAPTSGPLAGGTVVTVNGTGFVAVSSVTFGGVPGTALAVSSRTALRVTAPAHAAGTVDVRVVTAYGTS